MAYNNPTTITYSLGSHDFGNAANEALAIQGPPGKKGYIKDIGVMVTETFAGSTSNAQILMGTVADPNYYAELNIANTTAAAGTYFNTTTDTDAIIVADLAADTQIEVDLIDAVGTPAGTGYVFITIDWY